jgi:ketosteroid isomerase-like protein
MDALRVATEAGDIAQLTALMADDIVIQSPITTLIRFEGKDQVRELFEHVFRHVKDVRFYQTLSDGDKMHAVFWRGRVGKYYLEEANLVRLNEQGQIAEMTIFMRALPGLFGLAEGLVPSMTRQKQGFVRSAITRIMLGFVAILYRSNESLVLALAGAGVRVNDKR